MSSVSRNNDGYRVGLVDTAVVVSIDAAILYGDGTRQRGGGESYRDFYCQIPRQHRITKPVM